jgi:predicted AAA+ superfamily ATPase
MGRLGALTLSLQRVLELAERALGEFVSEPLPPDAFERFRAFRWDTARGSGRLIAIDEPDVYDLDDLVGIDRVIAKLIANTEQFVAGHPSNHVLLYGDRGTGKSSAVKGLLGRFADRGLRIVEVQKNDLIHLPRVLAGLHGAPQRFLLFCDDLSFDSDERLYRELKAALEGSLVAPPDNVRIIATSNRRHLLPEKVLDARGAHLDESGELRLGETVDEKLALSDRFGLALGFFAFDQMTYLAIVEHHAMRAGVRSDPEQVREEALRWALDRSSRSGRTARQFVDDLAGREAVAGDCRDSTSREVAHASRSRPAGG